MSIDDGVVETPRIMLLYFLRHGDALDGGDDHSRVLSTKGKRQSRAIGKFLKQAGVCFEAAYSSPLIRAVQTAEMVLEECNHHKKAELIQAHALTNDIRRSDFEAWLKGLTERNHCLLVGHMPSLAEHAGRLLKMNDPNALQLPKCGLVCMETVNRRDAALRFFVSPKVLAGTMQ